MYVAKPKRPNTKRPLPQSSPVYEALARFNRDFGQVLEDLERLEALRLFPRRWQRKFLKQWRATLAETRAWVSFEVVEVLHQTEERAWVRFARIRQRAEKQSASDEVLLPPQPTPERHCVESDLAKNVNDGHLITVQPRFQARDSSGK